MTHKIDRDDNNIQLHFIATTKVPQRDASIHNIHVSIGDEESNEFDWRVDDDTDDTDDETITANITTDIIQPTT